MRRPGSTSASSSIGRVGRDWQIDGKFIAHPAGRTIPIVNIIGMTDEIPNPGAVEFQRDGKTFRLEALD
jgi:uncharacterized protein (DUF1684 family)